MFHPIEELEEHLVEIASILAREDPITIQSVQSKLREYRLSGWTEKQSVKAVLRIATHYRKHGQLGRFRVALLTGTTMFGSSFVTKAERTGLLLSNETGLESFRRFLTHFAVETGVSVSGDWRFLQERLHTYLAYEQLVVATAAKQRTVLRLLRVSPREAIKKVLALTQLRFLSHIDFPVPSHINEWLNEFGPPEELASIASLLVALANKFRPLDSIDFAFPLTADIASAEMRRLMECGSALHQRYEVAKDISLFGYRLEAIENNQHSKLFYLHPPSLAFEYANRLGFIRSEIGSSKALFGGGYKFVRPSDVNPWRRRNVCGKITE